CCGIEPICQCSKQFPYRRSARLSPGSSRMRRGGDPAKPVDHKSNRVVVAGYGRASILAQHATYLFNGCRWTERRWRALLIQVVDHNTLDAVVYFLVRDRHREAIALAAGTVAGGEIGHAFTTASHARLRSLSRSPVLNSWIRLAMVRSGPF